MPIDKGIQALYDYMKLAMKSLGFIAFFFQKMR